MPVWAGARGLWRDLKTNVLKPHERPPITRVDIVVDDVVTTLENVDPVFRLVQKTVVGISSTEDHYRSSRPHHRD